MHISYNGLCNILQVLESALPSYHSEDTALQVSKNPHLTPLSTGSRCSYDRTISVSAVSLSSAMGSLHTSILSMDLGNFLKDLLGN